MTRARVPVLLCLSLALGLAGDTAADAPSRAGARRRRPATATTILKTEQG